MDWAKVIERNGGALRLVLAGLAAMAGPAPAGARPTLPRRLHRAILRLLRPAEAALRRLVVIVARDRVAAAPAGTTSPCANVGRRPVASSGASPRATVSAGALPRLSFPLFDPLPDPTAPSPRIRTEAWPRICVPGWTMPAPVPPRPSPDDPLDAGRLHQRLAALGHALDDLPAQARRLARWRARRDAARGAGRRHRVAPLRSGPPRCLHRGSPDREHPVHAVLRDLHHFAREAMT